MNKLRSKFVFSIFMFFSLLASLVGSAVFVTPVRAALSFINKTTADGLGSNYVNNVFVSGSNVYAATGSGLSISTDGGATFTNKTTADGLGHNYVTGVFASGSTIYASTGGGLSISTDGGDTFTNRTTTNGLGDNWVNGVSVSGSNIYAATQAGLSTSTDGGATFTTQRMGVGGNQVSDVFASGSNVYAATDNGLSISTDGGATFTTKGMADGLGHSYVQGVFASGSNVYAGTNNGLSISTDGGATFTNKTSADGLPSNFVYGVFASGSTVYGAAYGGLAMSIDDGSTFTYMTTADGLGSNTVSKVFASGSTVYAATSGGLSISAASTSKNITDFSFATPAAVGEITGNDIAVTVPFGTDVTALVPTIIHSGASISPNSGVAQDFTNPVTYTVTAEDASTKIYTVTVTIGPDPSLKDITAFSFTSPAATGVITGTNIAVTVPFGTDVTALVPAITHTGASVSPNSGVAQNFTNPVDYTVTARNASTKTYSVTVTVALNPAKDITAFSFASPSAVGIITGTNIAVTVPLGTNVTALVPTITHTGASVSPNSGVAQNFTNPVDYTVTAADSTTKTYTVTVHVAVRLYAKPVATGTGACSSWANACTLQTALTGAFSGDEIWVAAGTHKPTTGTDRSATFQLKDGVAIYGGFAGTETALSQRNSAINVTILSGDIDNNDSQTPIITNLATVTGNTANSYHVTTGATGATLDGFTITAGYADSYPNHRGGGMYNSSSSPAVTNVTFRGNFASYYGGGMYNDSGNPTLTNVTFMGNKANQWGGGVDNQTGNSSLTNVTFSGNSAPEGAGMVNYQSNSTLRNVTFSGNTSSGNGGGLLTNGGYSTFTNITFSGNSAGGNGGGVYTGGGYPTFTNVTFSGNTAVGSGGGLFNYNYYSNGLNIRNTIFWGNTAASGAQLSNYWIYPPLLSDSVIQGGCPAYTTCTNTLTTDPLLGALGNYGGYTQTVPLLVGSSAIDTGNDAICPATDQRGVARPQDVHCDIGAYEANNTAPVAVDDAYDATMSALLNGSSVLANDTDAEIDPLTASLVSGPSHASAFTLNADGTFAYTAVDDYQGTDTFTYNANDGTADSNTATVTINITPLTMTLESVAANDGWIRETTETSGVGGTITNNLALNVGDDNLDRQYRAVLHFNTSLPAGAVITKVTLTIKQIDVTGNPFNAHGNLIADIRKGSFGTSALESSDFEFLAASNQKNNAGKFIDIGGGWHQLVLSPANYPYIKMTGVTQFRLRFALDDNNDTIADYVRFFAGNASINRPQLIIEYYVP